MGKTIELLERLDKVIDKINDNYDEFENIIIDHVEDSGESFANTMETVEYLEMLIDNTPLDKPIKNDNTESISFRALMFIIIAGICIGGFTTWAILKTEHQSKIYFDCEDVGLEGLYDAAYKHGYDDAVKELEIR